MRSYTLPGVVALLTLTGCGAGAPAGDARADRDEPAAAGGGDAAKIAEAMSAAPASIARDATIMDWPETEDGEMRVLREGTNGWVCYPSSPVQLGEASGFDPMCFDEMWQQWAGAWFGHTTPAIDRVGIAYMLQGDRGASNTDPYATAPTPDNEWVVSGPHLMLLVPNTADLDGLPTDPANGGPWVMWKDTPYAHVMMPID